MNEGKIYKIDSLEVKTVATSDLKKSVAQDLLAEDKNIEQLLTKSDKQTSKKAENEKTTQSNP